MLCVGAAAFSWLVALQFRFNAVLNVMAVLL